MKKINQFALGFAIALTGAAGFTACSSEENMDVNPSYNKQTGELNVDFVFNISHFDFEHSDNPYDLGKHAGYNW